MAFTSKTKEIIDSYYKENSHKSDAKSRMITDRKELYEYEEQIQTQLVDMNSDQIIGLMKYLYQTGLEEATLHTIYQKYKAFIRHNLILLKKENSPARWNPFDEPGMAWSEVYEQISDKEMILTREDLDKVARAILSSPDLEKDKALLYVSTMILVYYGIPTANDLLNLKTRDVNLDTGEIRANDRVFKLDDAALNILRSMNDAVSKAENTTFEYLQYHESFIRLPIRNNKVIGFQSEKEDVVAQKVSRIFYYINGYSEKKISARKIYMVGLYNYFVGKFGVNTANAMITSYKNKVHADVVAATMDEYGFSYLNLSKARKELSQYIK